MYVNSHCSPIGDVQASYIHAAVAMASGSSFAPPKLADYILTERLGSGTYATVYKAYSKVGQQFTWAAHLGSSPGQFTWVAHLGSSPGATALLSMFIYLNTTCYYTSKVAYSCSTIT